MLRRRSDISASPLRSRRRTALRRRAGRRPIGYYNLPGNFCQCFGYGNGGGYHACLVLGPANCGGCCDQHEVRLACRAATAVRLLWRRQLRLRMLRRQLAQRAVDSRRGGAAQDRNRTSGRDVAADSPLARFRARLAVPIARPSFRGDSMQIVVSCDSFACLACRPRGCSPAPCDGARLPPVECRRDHAMICSQRDRARRRLLRGRKRQRQTARPAVEVVRLSGRIWCSPAIGRTAN